MVEYEERLRELLKKLFQIEDLNFGIRDFEIYRIMKQKRDEINKFIDTDLIEAVGGELAEYSSTNKEEIEREIEDIKERVLGTLGEGAILPNGDVKSDFQGTPLAREYGEKRGLLQQKKLINY